MAVKPGPQSVRGTNPIDTAPMAAFPIKVRTTRRERFMMQAPSSQQLRATSSLA
jgi:hypothetical protein